MQANSASQTPQLCGCEEFETRDLSLTAGYGDDVRMPLGFMNRLIDELELRCSL